MPSVVVRKKVEKRTVDDKEHIVSLQLSSNDAVGEVLFTSVSMDHVHREVKVRMHGLGGVNEIPV